MNVAQDRPVEEYILSLSKDELAQDMLQRCLAGLKACATEATQASAGIRAKPDLR